MDRQENRAVIVADGAYSGTENTQLAADKNVELITTSLTGKPAPDILADFEFNEEGTKVLRCPAGHAPKSCSYMKQSNQCAVSFLHEQCVGCPYQDQCKPKIFKRVAKIVTSKADIILLIFIYFLLEKLYIILKTVAKTIKQPSTTKTP